LIIHYNKYLMNKLPIYLASTLLLGSAMQARADVVKLTTALSVGDNLQIALNADMQVELEWENGEKQTLTGKGVIENIPVKDATLTITSAGKMTTLYLSNNELTQLDLSNAPNLQTLIASDNRLESISLQSQTELVSLDLQNNQLSTINVNKSAQLKDINVAGNQVKTLTLASDARPETIVAADCELVYVPSAASLTELKTLWVDNNQIKTLNLSQSPALVSLHASQNALSKVTLTEVPMLKDLWVENNDLTTLDLSNGLGSIHTFAVGHNKLTEVAWDRTKRTLKYAYMDNNALFFNSMPTLSALEQYSLMPQEDYDLGTACYPLNEKVELKSLFSRNGWNNSVYSGSTYRLVDRNGQELVEGKDYTVATRDYTFLTEQVGVRFEIDLKTYPGMTFVTKRFNIGVPTGITDIASGKEGMEIQSEKGGLCIKATAPVTLRIYSTAGACIVHENVGAGIHRYALPAGVYVVNGEKAVVR